MTRKQYRYAFPRPMVSADAVVFTRRHRRLEVLLVKRKNEPFAGCWALPGGFVEMEETIEEAVRRELEEETGVSQVRLRQFCTFGDPGRDPRGRSITIAYVGVTDWRRHTPKADDDAAEAAWFPVNDLPQLAFDHNEIIRQARRAMKTQ
ncbi:MAG: NUDIX hydrolase [Candidatus Hydrogenedentes bacterium]|nr:NUDIX hydrolase [Candidatus Hydrogenedentota bacterium]